MNDQSLEAQNFLYKHVHARANHLIYRLLDRYDNYSEDEWYSDLFLQYEEPDELDAPENSEDYPPELEPRAPYEFWIVSELLASKLKERDALLTDDFGFWIWGRETTGQSILIDWIFQDIWHSVKND